MRSDMIKVGVDKAPARGLLYATGQVKSAKDMQKPFIAICNSYIDIVPGHVHLRELADIAKEAIREAGGIPFEFNTIGVDDGIAMGHIGMRYSLPSRELIADSAETVINAHWFDGVFYIPNCDKITPGMILAAMRTNVPAVFCSGGPMKGGVDMTGHQATLSSLFEAVGTYQAGDMRKEELDYLEKKSCPNCGSCSGMFTANSMNCLMEVFGLALPGNGTILAVSDERRELVRQAATKLMDNIKNNVRPRDIVTKEAIDDARLNAKMNGFDNAEFFVGKAEEVLPREYEKNGVYADTIVVDPPRKGCDSKLLETMVKMAPKRIVYVSCDPATLARDLKVLSEQGYEVEKVCAVDQFSHSSHVETVVRLKRK